MSSTIIAHVWAAMKAGDTSATAPELAAELSMPLGRVRHILSQLKAKGLAELEARYDKVGRQLDGLWSAIGTYPTPRPPAPARRERAETTPGRVIVSAVEVKRSPRVTLRLVEDGEGRPRTRGDCVGGPRPCPWVSCAHHLYLDVSDDTGSVRANFPALEPDELAESCALDVADEGPQQLEHVGAVMNLTRERVRQIEAAAMGRIERRMRDLDDVAEMRVRHLRVVQGGGR